MMNLDWITNPLTIYATVFIGSMAGIHLVVAARIEMRRQQQRHMAERGTMEEALAALRGKVDELALESTDRSLVPVPGMAMTGLNVQKRAEALRMYRRGADHHTVSATLGLPHAEMELLHKVHHILREAEGR